MNSSWRFWIDRGGTFTDIVALAPDGAVSVHKLLSENPGRYTDAAIAGIKTVLGIALDAPIPAGLVAEVKMGTTVATNALLERRGAAVLLLVNRGFADLPRIGNQTRPRLFDLAISRPALLHSRVAEVAGRIAADGAEIEPLDLDAAALILNAAKAEGIEAVAIALMHAWKYPAHERKLAELARSRGFAQVSASHEVSPLLRLVPRADTTTVDAYLSPVLRRYVDQVAGALPEGAKLYFMQSHGGLAEAHGFMGKDAILSGPAGGIVGAARTAASAGLHEIIGFDMGGTSTDVALYAGGFERAFETEVAGVRLRAPMMAINTVAAGGGSILHFDGARFRVGPDSAGADPGPAAYRRGGPLTVTDANLCLGKIQPRHFPAIFGPNGDQPLDLAAVREKFAALADEITAATGERRDIREIAEGFLCVAVANMANAIKQVSVQKGHDVGRFTLQCFGGAGGQHACLVADELGMETVFIHPHAGVLSAYGMGLADQTAMREQAVEAPLDEAIMPRLDELTGHLADQAKSSLVAQGALPNRIVSERRAHLRYAGSEAALIVPFGAPEAMRADFEAAHKARFGFVTPERPVTVEAVAVEATAPGEHPPEPALPPRGTLPLVPIDEVDIWSAASRRALVYGRESLRAGDRIEGPALIREAIATTVIELGWRAEITGLNHMILRRTAPRARTMSAAATDQPDPVLLELFNNLFMNIAEQTGAVLANTAQSVNIKERLDFSCAIFDAAGRLIANAPHVPVHLGAMGESVRTVLRQRRETLKPGDVVALNNPFNGGTHLPDITVITPVFGEDGTIAFFLGSRGHHADIGGITPGSTPPQSRSLNEEGVVIDDFLLVDGGHFRETEFRVLLAGAQHPARSPDVNVADIKAQVGANEKGVAELRAVVVRYGWPLVSAYMRHVRENAAASVRRVIDRISDGAFSYRMDDGAELRVAVSVDRAARCATIDFTGTSLQRQGNFNAPPAVTRAVVLYVFRCLTGADIPLNDGCLDPLRIVIPRGTFLSPEPGAAVVAGNTEVSQACCNALLGALGAEACSQATMNNFLFGDTTRQYYETICGGTGAGPDFDGTDAIHSHMTNTRMTDPEVLELRYPVRLEEFAIRRGSGGAGQHRGGDGAIRRLRFLEPMTATIVASRRNVPPFGLAGGADGAAGRQWIDCADGRREVLEGTDQAALEPGDVVTIETPGGGGFGK